MSALYNFPEKAFFGKVLPKEKIYQHASISSRVKEYFVRDVKKIIWSYKLAPETINLPARDGINEIQVLTIRLKAEKFHHDVLRIIDKNIPTPVLFTISFRARSRYVAACKRRSEADRDKWVISSHFQTDWIDDSAPRAELPVVLDMASLYRAILENILPIPARPQESLRDFVERAEQIMILERDAKRLRHKMNKERQFNRKVELNRQLKKINREIEHLRLAG